MAIPGTRSFLWGGLGYLYSQVPSGGGGRVSRGLGIWGWGRVSGGRVSRGLGIDTLSPLPEVVAITAVTYWNAVFYTERQQHVCNIARNITLVICLQISQYTKRVA